MELHILAHLIKTWIIRSCGDRSIACQATVIDIACLGDYFIKISLNLPLYTGIEPAL